MLNIFEKIILISIILFVMFPNSFAEDNSTYMGNDEVIQENYFFNISVQNDGNGSYNNPYKFLNADRLKENSKIFFANGQYKLDSLKNIENITIYGENQNKTSILYEGVAFNVVNSFKIQNIKLVNLSINNTGNIIAKNVIFDGGMGSNIDEYHNTFGGAIHSFYGNIDIDNCTFMNTHAEYGGAIYIKNGILNIKNSKFINTYSDNYGGAIACEDNVTTFISKSKFKKTVSLNDAGGTLYIKFSRLFASNLNITDSYSNFGGGITALKSEISIYYSNLHDNCAKYFGGAIYQIYGNLLINNSNFKNNTASSGGALFIDNITSLNMMNNVFTLNSVNAIHSISNNPVMQNNTFNINQTIHEIQSVSLKIGSGNYTLIKCNSSFKDNLPSCYSLIDEYQVTNVKNQETAGNCWAFATMAVLESCILKATGNYTDLSEENMKNLMAVYSDYGWILDTNNGAYAFMPFNYLVSWLGPINEKDDEYDDKSTLSPILNSIYHVQNIKFLRHDNFTDNDEIKQALMKYGAVGVGMAYNDIFLNKKTNAYYSYANTKVNHAVTIVGWDDSYSKYNFRWSSMIKGNGAWIVRNSWGSDWADGGYFYVSYYDPKFALTTSNYVPYTFVLNETIKNDKNYQYDIGGITNYFIIPNNTIYYKNIFKATDNEFLTSVSTFFQKQCNWTLTITINKQCKLIKSGFTSPGYYTINLNQLIPLNKDDEFEIMFKIITSNQASFPISEAKYLNKQLYSSEISYMSFDGKIWKDLSNYKYNYSNHYYESQVASIKAFTILNPINTSLFLNITATEIKVQIIDENGNHVNSGNVTFNLDGEVYAINVKNGNAILNSISTRNINKISAIFNAVGYNASFYTILQKTELKLNINKSSNNIIITLISQNNINMSIPIKINNEMYNVTLIDGKASLSLKNLSNAFYNISVVSQDCIITELININVEKTKIIVNPNKNYTFILMDSNGKGIPNKKLQIFLNNTEYNIITNKNGEIILPILLIEGNYSIKIIFEGDDGYFKSDLIKNIQIKTPIKSTIKVLTYSNNALIIINSSNTINKIITFKINSEIYKINEKSLYLSNLESGQYNVSIYIDNEFINSTSFDINISKTKIISSDITVYEGEYFEFKTQLVDNNNRSVCNRIITLYLNNYSYDLTTNNQGRITKIFNLTAGDYNIQLNFNGDDKFYKSNSSYKIKVIKKKLTETKIIAHDLITYYKSNYNYTITLMDINNNPLENRIIEFKLDNNTYFKNTNSKGQASLGINLKDNDYFIKISYFGDKNFSNSTYISKIMVKSSIIVEDSLTKTFNSKYTIKILDSNGVALVNSKVYLIFNNVEYLKTSDENGNVFLSINVNPGSYLLKIVNLDNMEEKMLNINIIPRIILNTGLTFFEYSKREYTILLLDDNGYPLNNAFVKIMINNKIFTIKTNNGGYASLKLELLANKYTIIAYYNGFKLINVIDVKSFLFAKNMIFKKSKQYKFSAKLLNKLKGKKIIFKIKNKKYISKTNKNGVASIKIKLKLKRGEYKIITSYLKSKIVNKIKIK